MDLKYKGGVYKHGDVIKGSINGDSVEGHLVIEGDQYYFCQNKHSGNSCSYQFGHAYSWVFTSLSDNELSEGVEITSKGKDLSKFHKRVVIKVNPDSTSLITNQWTLKFHKSQYPSCCGSMIYHRMGALNPSAFIEFLKESEEFIEGARDVIVGNYPNITVILQKEKQAKFIEIFKLIGFTELNSFINYNDSNHELVMLNYNGIQ